MLQHDITSFQATESIEREIHLTSMADLVFCRSTAGDRSRVAALAASRAEKGKIRPAADVSI